MKTMERRDDEKPAKAVGDAGREDSRAAWRKSPHSVTDFATIYRNWRKSQVSVSRLAERGAICCDSRQGEGRNAPPHASPSTSAMTSS